MKYLILICCFCSIQNLYSQQKKTFNNKDLIQVETGMNSPKFYLNTQRVPLREVKSRIAGYTDALKYIRKGETMISLKYITGIIGGFGIGWEIGKMIRGAKINPVILGGGAVLAGTSIAFHSSANKNFQRGVNAFRDGSLGFREKKPYNLYLGFNANGNVAVALTF